ncbi:MAG: transcriptional regulator [Pseudonocardiales bacterium]|nr:transcriptional regulator [Pseudonocardiales bacterium]
MNPILPPSNIELSSQLSTFYGLFVLSLIMFGLQDEDEIFRLAISAVPSLGPFRVANTDRGLGSGEGVLEAVRDPDEPQTVDDSEPEARLEIAGFGWARTYELRGFDRVHGHLVAVSDGTPSEHEQFLLKALVHQTSAALSSAGMYSDAVRRSDRLSVLNDEKASANHRLQDTISSLERQARTHERLAQAMAREGEAGLVDALYELTGLAAAIEDQFGNLKVWAGPDRSPAPRKLSIGRLAELRRRMLASNGRPIRAGGRLMARAKPGTDVLGFVTLLDPHRQGAMYETLVLEQASSLLAMELAHQRGVAELELRLRRELVDELLDGADSASVYPRAAAVGHDLQGPHHVLSLRWRGDADERATAAAAERALDHLGNSWLLARRQGRCVVIVQGLPDTRRLFEAIAADLSPDGSIGVGRTCDVPAQIPESYEQSVRALSIRERSRSPNGVTSFAELGVYRILGTPQTMDDVAAFVEQWLGALLAYDARRHTDLVATLAQYLDCGGNYDQTADALLIHRSTLRYRLRRIRELADVDLGDVDSRLNLHLATRAWKIIN